MSSVPGENKKRTWLSGDDRLNRPSSSHSHPCPAASRKDRRGREARLPAFALPRHLHLTYEACLALSRRPRLRFSLRPFHHCDSHPTAGTRHHVKATLGIVGIGIEWRIPEREWARLSLSRDAPALPARLTWGSTISEPACHCDQHLSPPRPDPRPPAAAATIPKRRERRTRLGKSWVWSTLLQMPR